MIKSHYISFSFLQSSQSCSAMNALIHCFYANELQFIKSHAKYPSDIPGQSLWVYPRQSSNHSANKSKFRVNWQFACLPSISTLHFRCLLWYCQDASHSFALWFVSLLIMKVNIKHNDRLALRMKWRLIVWLILPVKDDIISSELTSDS